MVTLSHSPLEEANQASEAETASTARQLPSASQKLGSAGRPQPESHIVITRTVESPDNLVGETGVFILAVMEEGIVFSWVNLGLNLLPGALLWVIQALVRRFPPGPVPSQTYGYRTKRSMASPEAWAYANQRSIDLYAMYAWPLMAAAVLFTLYATLDTAQLLLYSAFTVACVWPLVVIERALKRGDHLRDGSEPTKGDAD